MTAPFLITGAGRSGTGWASAFFTALGYPCGHETVFGVNGPGAFNQPDSSWLAVPYAAQTPLCTPLLRIMRDPRQVVMSALAKGFLADLDDPFARYVRSFRPSITRPADHLTRVIRYVALWDDPLDDLGHTVLKSDGGLEHQASAVDVATRTLHARGMIADAMVLVGNRVNTSREGEPDPVSLEWLATHPDYALIRRRAERFGYR
jgi:hypothetical protein